jgi:hypothetical protein
MANTEFRFVIKLLINIGNYRSLATAGKRFPLGESGRAGQRGVDSHQT